MIIIKINITKGLIIIEDTPRNIISKAVNKAASFGRHNWRVVIA